jgi:hypothetical protein
MIEKINKSTELKTEIEKDEKNLVALIWITFGFSLISMLLATMG